MAYESNDAKAAAGFSAAAAISSVMAWLNSRKVSGGDWVFPDEVVQLIVAIAATSEDMKAGLDTIISELQSWEPGTGGGWPANADAITALRVLVAPTGTQLPSITIPSGMTLVIKAWALNPGWLQVGPSLAECTNVNQSFPLLPNETVSYQVENADQIYVSGTIAGCYACLTVEQRRAGGV